MASKPRPIPSTAPPGEFRLHALCVELPRYHSVEIACGFPQTLAFALVLFLFSERRCFECQHAAGFALSHCRAQP